MALTNIYSKNGYLAVAHTGNTLGMAGDASQPQYWVNAYTTLNSSQNNGVGVPSNTGSFTSGGTTNSYLSNGSFAYLNPPTSVVPAGSTVDYAVVTWIGNTNAPSSLALIDTATIPFTDPTGTVHILTPDLALNNQGVGIYNIISRSADVTSIVSSAGYGKYTLERVPGATLTSQATTVGGVGWALFVVYKNSNLPYRNVTINVGTVQQNILQTISGFYTPATGNTIARVFGAWSQGNSDFANDSLQFNNTNLSGPNNPITNFFCGQINNELGTAQNTFGSFANQSSTPGQRPIGQRTAFDITNVSANNVLANSQRTTTMMAQTPGGEATNTHVLGVQIDNNAPIIAATKAVNLTTAEKGNTLLYTLVFKNTGIPVASNVIFKDTIPSNTTFVSNSLTINGVPSSSNPQDGVTLPNLSTNAVVTVQFSVNISNSITQSVTIPNVGELAYKFIGDPSLPSVDGNMSTNTVNTRVLIPNFSVLKSEDKSFVTIGDTILYTIVVSNNTNSDMNTVNFVDTIPTGTIFVPNSLAIDNVPSSSSPAPPGINIGSLPATLARTITFRVQVVSIPTGNQINNVSTASNSSGDVVNSNTVSAIVNSVILNSNKIVNKNYANIGDILTYTIPITNTGNTTASNILFIDTIPSGTSFIANSLKQDGVILTSSSNPPGVTLPNAIGINQTSTITFQVQITTIPNPNPISNTASVTTSFTIDSTTLPNRVGNSSSNTNTVNTSVNFASLLGLTKSVDKIFAICGDVITYTIVAPNSGSVTAQNVIFKDTIPNGTVLMPTSVYVNGVQQIGANPATGVTIPNIGPGTTSTVTFSVQIQC